MSAGASLLIGPLYTCSLPMHYFEPQFDAAAQVEALKWRIETVQGDTPLSL